MVAMPASSTGLRPKRSESGPQNSMPAARPMKYAVRVNCPALTVAPSERVSSGSAGTNRSVPSAGSAIRMPSSRSDGGSGGFIQDRIRF